MPRDRRPRDDDEDEDDRPARKRRRVEEDDEDEAPRPKPKPKPRVVDEDEDEPPRRVKPRVVDEDDEDEEEERPRRRKKKRKPAGMNKGLLFGLIGGGLALVLVVVLLIVFLGGGGSPKSVVERSMKAIKNGDFGTMYDNMAAPLQKMLAESTRIQAARDPSLAAFRSLGDRELVVAVSKEKEKTRGNPFKEQSEATILGETITGDTATVRVRNPNGREETIPMVKENGRWKIGGL